MGQDNYFIFTYDNLEDIGQSYHYSYAIFNDTSRISVCFAPKQKGENFKLKFEKKFIIEAENNKYEVMKFRYSAHNVKNYHYLCKDFGLLAVDGGYNVLIVEKNSVISDTAYQIIYTKLIDIIEKNGQSDKFQISSCLDD
jgi:hypothetical protein